MEKLGVSQDEHIESLRNEEAQLMQQMGEMMSDPQKLASAERQSLDARLTAVRNKITEIDLNRKPQ